MQLAVQTERFLDDLVTDTVTFRALREAQQDEKATVFLQLSTPMQYEYILETLAKRIPLGLLENGRLYVVTPSCGFEYNLSDGKIQEPMLAENLCLSRPIRNIGIDASGNPDLWSLTETVRRMKLTSFRAIEKGAKQHRILFFNFASKDGFEKNISGDFIKADVLGLEIPSYGTLNCYTYISQQISPTR